jgi:hypothetical protein
MYGEYMSIGIDPMWGKASYGTTGPISFSNIFFTTTIGRKPSGVGAHPG